MHTFDLSLKEISKIEGKATLILEIKNDKIIKLKFKITEFKRFYTQAIRGKDVIALPQLTARICGTCSNAHVLCTIQAVENALGITPSEQTKTLRKLLNFGLNIRDHALHLYVFALPDILGIDNILELDEKDPKQHVLLDDTFIVKAAGNTLSKLIGGRSVHAPYPIVGGFSHLPDSNEFSNMIRQLENIRPAVLRLIKIFYTCKFQLDRILDFVALLDDDYSFLDGEIIENSGEKIKKEAFGSYLKHVVIPYSHASGYKYKGSLHMIGALARMNLGKDNIHPRTKKDASFAIKLFPSRNIYHNNLAQAIEILHSVDSSIEILQKLVIRPEPSVSFIRKAGIGIGVIEAPRGTLYYKLEFNNEGKVIIGDIIVPTGQNQIGIEKSIYDYVNSHLHEDRETIIQEIEQIIRAYDPCMSCASHFLTVKWKNIK